MLVGELQKKILVSSGGVTYVIDQLEAKGLVARRPCAEDRRAVYAELTTAGRKLIDRIFPQHAQAVEAAVSGLSRKEQEEAIAALQ